MYDPLRMGYLVSVAQMLDETVQRALDSHTFTLLQVADAADLPIWERDDKGNKTSLIGDWAAIAEQFVQEFATKHAHFCRPAAQLAPPVEEEAIVAIAPRRPSPNGTGRLHKSHPELDGAETGCYSTKIVCLPETFAHILALAAEMGIGVEELIGHLCVDGLTFRQMRSHRGGLSHDQ